MWGAAIRQTRAVEQRTGGFFIQPNGTNSDSEVLNLWSARYIDKEEISKLVNRSRQIFRQGTRHKQDSRSHLGEAHVRLGLESTQSLMHALSTTYILHNRHPPQLHTSSTILHNSHPQPPLTIEPQKQVEHRVRVTRNDWLFRGFARLEDLFPVQKWVSQINEKKIKK